MSHRALGRQWDEHASAEIASQDIVTRNQRATGLYGSKPDWEKAPVEQVEVRKLKPTQRFLFQYQHDRVRQAEGELPPVRVLRKGATHYVVDGHHRWDMAKERGTKTIQARVIDG